MAKKKRDALFVFMDKGYMIGLPARNMTEDEWLSYPSELTKPALKQGLYRVITQEQEEVNNA